MHSAPPPTTSGEATRPRFRPAPEAPWTGAAGTAWADAPRPGAAGPPWTGAARAWATTGTGEACPGGAMAPISHPGAADHGPGEGLVCARTGRGPTPVTTPSAARTGTWRSSAPLLPAGRGPSDPQQGSDLVEDLDGLVDGGRRHDGGELLPGLGRAGGAPGDVGQKMRHEGPQRGAREPVRDKGRAVLARAGPVSSSMRTTPTAYRSWAGSGSAPYLAPRGTRGRACRSPGSPARAGAPRWAPPCRSPRGRCPARSPGAAGCRRASVAVDEPCRVDDVEGLEQLADGRQHPGLRQRAVVAQQPRRGAAVHERHGEDDAVVLDASGSMASEDGTGTPTIDAARKSLTSLVDSLPTDAKVGMRVLGATVNTDPMPAGLRRHPADRRHRLRQPGPAHLGHRQVLPQRLDADPQGARAGRHRPGRQRQALQRARLRRRVALRRSLPHGRVAGLLRRRPHDRRRGPVGRRDDAPAAPVRGRQGQVLRDTGT